MALINCPDCGREVSDLASACPGCARPLQAASSAPVTIEQTSKPYKGAQVVGVVLIFAGLIGTAWSLGLGGLVACAGFCVWISARMGAWWANG